MRKNVLNSRKLGFGLLSLACAAVLTGCGSGSTSNAQPASTTNTVAGGAAAREAELEARAQQLAQREAEVAAKEREQQKAHQVAAAVKKASRASSTSDKNATASSYATERSRATPASAPTVEVPAGTQLTVALSSDLSTKTAKPGDAFEAQLAADLVIGNHYIAPAGSRLTGKVSEVLSGSNSIGTVPKLGLKFEYLEIAQGRQLPISAEFLQEGQSEKVRDTAKILGGAAAGAIIGHQVKRNDTGTVVGGLLGGAAGALVAKKTGTEVQLATGATLTITLSETLTVAGS